MFFGGGSGGRGFFFHPLVSSETAPSFVGECATRAAAIALLGKGMGILGGVPLCGDELPIELVDEVREGGGGRIGGISGDCELN